MIPGAPWGSKGRTAVFAPWLPPAIWQKPRIEVFKQSQLKLVPTVEKALDSRIVPKLVTRISALIFSNHLANTSNT
ncbi:MAG: hypothetical protein ACTJFX_07735, partial [Pseudoalteromonas prydzensis]